MLSQVRFFYSKESLIKQVIGTAIIKILRPLVRILIRKSVPFGTFVEYAKWVYVHVAYAEFSDSLKKNSNSKVSTMTGISRHDVKKILNEESPNETDSIFKHNKAARVISGWVKDSDFIDKKGPKDLVLENDKFSFESLINKYCGDLPPKPIMEELIRVGSVEILDNHKVRLVNQAYIPYHEDSQKISILGVDVCDLISTIDHNLTHTGKDDFLQLKVWSDEFNVKTKAKLKKLSKEKGLSLMNEIDRWVDENVELDDMKDVEETKYRAGLGVYYFEEKRKEN